MACVRGSWVGNLQGDSMAHLVEKETLLRANSAMMLTLVGGGLWSARSARSSSISAGPSRSGKRCQHALHLQQRSNAPKELRLISCTHLAPRTRHALRQESCLFSSATPAYSCGAFAGRRHHARAYRCSHCRRRDFAELAGDQGRSVIESAAARALGECVRLANARGWSRPGEKGRLPFIRRCMQGKPV